MKIKNKTNYSTRGLHKLFTLCLKHYKKISGESKKLSVVFVKSSFTSLHGRAPYGGDWLIVHIPEVGMDVQDLAKVFLHEYEHCLGYKHKEIGGWKQMEDTSFVKDFLLPTKIPKEKEVKEVKPLRQSRYERVLKGIDKYTRLAKTVARRLRKLNDKRRYYERAFALALRVPKEINNEK